MIGGALMKGNSKLFTGPLGVVKIGFDGYDLGKTTADSILKPDQDIKDIIYQQDGTKAGDHVRTGIDYILTVTFGEIKTGLLVELMGGISSNNTDKNSDSGTVGRNIYTSMRDNEAGPLKVVSVDANGVPSEDIEDTLIFYEAIPIIDGDLLDWGADTQRNLPVSFHVKFHVFATGESSTKVGAFGYWGDPTVEDVPAVNWIDVAGPVIVTAIASSATLLTISFNEDIAFQSAFDGAHYSAKIGGVYATPTAGTITNKDLALTFPASTFSSGDVITLSISELELQDTETTPNKYSGINDYLCTNSI